MVKSNLDYLLDLDGEVFPFDSGYWVKFEATRVKSNKNRPHGVKYSLTLHDSNNNRILGYDNAHAVKTSKQHRKIEWDHKHDKEKLSTYQFVNAGKLLEDFWNDVSKAIPKF